MKKIQVLIDRYSAEELDSRFEKMQRAIENLTPASAEPQWITRTEAAELLKVTTRTLQNWSNAGVLQQYSLANRIYLRLDEVHAAMTRINAKR